ncbi:MAG TPA: HD domain-containing protein [Desulfitobacterium dehalogenans]|uniref:HD domain-containing protein n=1 Tax=Desulfitobacterium dehalogenans TaxID=36854 RepID=A0A7C6Z4G7_9FIRM|nr:HD domain-containing protein [Desulfitobacterium dehalogenans]
MFYRVHQFWKAIHPIIREEELEWAISLLPPHSLPLFQAQPLPEQRHALDVALDLWDSGIRDSYLLIAALLHDCGKTRYPLKVWERITIVLLQKGPRKIWNTLISSHFPISAPLRAAEAHPAWGAEMALEIGLDPHIVELIGEHHTPHSQEGYLLYLADNRH